MHQASRGVGAVVLSSVARDCSGRGPRSIFVISDVGGVFGGPCGACPMIRVDRTWGASGRNFE